jgi:DNA-binding transcriptional MerR regulator
MAEGEKLLGVKDASRVLGVSPNTLRKWSDQGIIHTARLPGSQYRRYTMSELQRVRREVMGLEN